jgi:hypothetical protein
MEDRGENEKKRLKRMKKEKVEREEERNEKKNGWKDEKWMER